MRLFSVIAATALLAACQPATLHGPSAVAEIGSASLNAYRLRAGHAPLRRDPRLDRAASAHAADMTAHGFMAHHGTDGGTHRARIRRSGYPLCGAAENIAKGSWDRDGVMATWWGSPAHRFNMTLDRVRDYGLAQVGDAWVMVLARPC